MIMTVLLVSLRSSGALIRERTSAGRDADRQLGVRFGRPRRLNRDQAQIASRFGR
jgi:DNA invertase Pin-like site-specific DNA recombinase